MCIRDSISDKRWFRKKSKSGFLHLMISMSYENEIVRFGTFYEFIIKDNYLCVVGSSFTRL